MDIQSVLKSKLVTILLVVVFAAVALVTLELYWQKREVDSEVARLTDRADSLGKDNQQLSELIQYLNTPDYKEKEAREKLNLKREGEQVVVLPDTSGQVLDANAEEAESNPKKWFNYFFN